MFKSFSISALIIFAGGCNIGPSVWVNQEEDLRIDLSGTQKLTVRSHNGYIEHTGRAGGDSAAIVKVFKKAGGTTQADAEEAMKQLEVFCEPQDPDGKLLSYRWKTTKHNSWNASVSFRIDAPATLGLDLESHNGEITARGVESSLRAVSHNGAVTADAVGPMLEADTHNGALDIRYGGPKIIAETHNGAIKVDLTRCTGEVGGEITSHNGRIGIKVGPETSAAVSASTSNGGINLQGNWKMHKSSRKRVEGEIGKGGPKLTVETHNGEIEITQ